MILKPKTKPNIKKTNLIKSNGKNDCTMLLFNYYIY